MDNRGCFTLPTKVATDPLLLEQHLQQMAEAWAAHKERQQYEKATSSATGPLDTAGASTSAQSQATTKAAAKEDLALLVSTTFRFLIDNQLRKFLGK